eukprot:191363-Amorphochlora_amoeboformis.AAC.1
MALSIFSRSLILFQSVYSYTVAHVLRAQALSSLSQLLPKCSTNPGIHCGIPRAISGGLWGDLGGARLGFGGSCTGEISYI